MSSDYKGDPSSAMLEVLDPGAKNTKFQDNYLNMNMIYLKLCLEINRETTMKIFLLLYQIRNLEPKFYTTNEKIKIAKEHLVDTAARQAD